MSSVKEKALYPWADEIAYAKKLVAMLNKLEKSVIGFVKSDSGMEGWEKRFDQFLETLKPIYGQGFAHDAAKTMINGVNRMVTVQLNKAIERHDAKKLVRDALGDYTDDEKAFMNAKLSENISLIKSVGDEYLNKVQDVIYRGYVNGTSTKDMITQIQAAASEGGVTTVSANRAKLIARDQTGSINGQLTRYKSQAAGISYFSWQTANDERVRPAHRDIDGKIFTWANGWAGVYPGDPIQCRCVAATVFDDEAAAADDGDFWDPEAEDAVFPSKKNGSPNPPKMEPEAVEKPEMPYYGSTKNKPGWLRSSGAKMNMPSEQSRTEISSREVKKLTEPIEKTTEKGYNNSMNQEISEVIDKFTPCLEDRKTGEILDTSYHEVKFSPKEAKKLQKQGWKFDWSKYSNQSITALTLKGSEEIQGLITFRDKEGFTFVDLAESAPHNIGHLGKYYGVGGHLFAIAAEESFKKGNEGYVSFTPKTKIIEHYKETLGARSMPNGNMYLDTIASLRLLEIYMKGSAKNG